MNIGQAVINKNNDKLIIISKNVQIDTSSTKYIGINLNRQLKFQYFNEEDIVNTEKVESCGPFSLGQKVSYKNNLYEVITIMNFGTVENGSTIYIAKNMQNEELCYFFDEQLKGEK